MRVRYGKPIKVKSLVGNQTSFSFLGGTSTIDTTIGDGVYQYNWGLSGNKKFAISIVTGHTYLHVIRFQETDSRTPAFYYKNTSGNSVRPYSTASSRAADAYVFMGTMTATSDYICAYFSLQRADNTFNHIPVYYFIVDLTTTFGSGNEPTTQQFYDKYNKYFPLIATGEEITIDDKAGHVASIITEGTTNRLGGLSDIFSSPYNGASNTYGWGTNTDIYRTTGIFQGKKCTKIYMGTPDQYAYPYPNIKNVNPYSTTVNQYCTLSFDYYPTTQTTLIPYSYRSGVDIVSRCNGVTLSSATIDNIVLNKWNHIEIIYKRRTDDYVGEGCGYIRIGPGQFKPTANDYWLFANVQTEYKDHATPYVDGTRPDNYPISYKIVGGSSDIYYGYNQLINNGDFSDTSAWSANGTGTTISISEGVCTCTPNGESQWPGISIYVKGYKANHKILYIVEAWVDSNNAGKSLCINNQTGLNNSIGILVEGWGTYSKITTLTEDKSSVTTAFFPYQPAIYPFKFRKIMAIDLTEWFGSGDEPTTLAEFRTRFTKEYYGTWVTPIKLTQYQIETLPNYYYNQSVVYDADIPTSLGLENCTKTVSGKEVTFTKTVNKSYYAVQINTNSTPCVKGDKILCYMHIKNLNSSLNNTTPSFGIVEYSPNAWLQNPDTYATLSTTNGDLYAIETVSKDDCTNCRLKILHTTAVEGQLFTMDRAMLINLTTWYGVGNEPSTIEEFKATFPNIYYKYSKRTLLNKYMINKL